MNPVHRSLAVRLHTLLACALVAGGPALAEEPIPAPADAPASPSNAEEAPMPEAAPAPAEPGAPPPVPEPEALAAAPVEVAMTPPAHDSDALVEAARALLDDRLPAEERARAAFTLAQAGDPRGVSFLRAAARDANPELSLAVLAAAATFPGAESVSLAEMVLRDDRQSRENRVHATQALGKLGAPGGDVAWQVAGDGKLPSWVRAEAQLVLVEAWPEVLAARGAPRVASDRLGAVALMAGNGTLGGAMLNSVGRWGQFDGGGAIGGVGGAAIGVGSAAIYARSKPVTRGQGLAYLSGNAWGVTLGALGTEAALGRPYHYDPSNEARREQLGPAFIIAGTAAGAFAGSRAVRSSPEAWDVLETDLAGYLGTSLALSVVDVSLWRPPADDTWDPQTGMENPDSAYADFRYRMSRVRPATAMVGAGAGLASGVLLKDRWELSGEDALFAGVVGMEASWVGLWWPSAFNINDANLKGTYRLPVHAAVVGALVYAEQRPVSARASLAGAWGGAMGNLIGAGVPMLGNAENDTLARVMLPAGIAGTALGVAGADWLDTSGADLGMTAVGMPLAIANGAAFSAWLSERDALRWQQPEGLFATTTGVAGAGLMLAGRYVEPKPDRSVFVGSSALWGGFYGLMVPLALDANLDDSEYGLVAAVTADAFAGVGAVLVSDRVGLKPGHTVLPQMGGLTGATVGALFVALASAEGDQVAAGAVGGAVLGTAGGAWLGHRARTQGVSWSPPSFGPRPRIAGHWAPTFSPLLSPDGGVGVHAGLIGTGW